MTRFKDYDAAIKDLEPEDFEFRIGGRDFVADSEADARAMLDFLRKTASTNSRDVADGMRAVLGEEVWGYIYERPKISTENGEVVQEERPKIPWPLIRALVNDLAVYYGGGIVGAPKAVVDAQQIVNPPMAEEPSTNGSEETSGSSTTSETLNELVLGSTEEE